LIAWSSYEFSSSRDR